MVKLQSLKYSNPVPWLKLDYSIQHITLDLGLRRLQSNTTISHNTHNVQMPWSIREMLVQKLMKILKYQKIGKQHNKIYKNSTKQNMA